MYHEKDECRSNDESHGPDQVFRIDGISKTAHYRDEEIDRLAEKVTQSLYSLFNRFSENNYFQILYLIAQAAKKKFGVKQISWVQKDTEGVTSANFKFDFSEKVLKIYMLKRNSTLNDSKSAEQIDQGLSQQREEHVVEDEKCGAQSGIKIILTRE